MYDIPLIRILMEKIKSNLPILIIAFLILFLIICIILYYRISYDLEIFYKKKINEEGKNSYNIKEFKEKYKDELAAFEKDKVF